MAVVSRGSGNSRPCSFDVWMFCLISKSDKLGFFRITGHSAVKVSSPFMCTCLQFLPQIWHTWLFYQADLSLLSGWPDSSIRLTWLDLPMYCGTLFCATASLGMQILSGVHRSYPNTILSWAGPEVCSQDIDSIKLGRIPEFLVLLQEFFICLLTWPQGIRGAVG